MSLKFLTVIVEVTVGFCSFVRSIVNLWMPLVPRIRKDPSAELG